MIYDVFITHTAKDVEWAKALCERLERKNIRCFIGCRDIPEGKLVSAESKNAMTEAHMLMVVYTRNFNSTPQINREIEAATTRGIPVLTVGFAQGESMLQETDRYVGWITSLLHSQQAMLPQDCAGEASMNICCQQVSEEESCTQKISQVDESLAALCVSDQPLVADPSLLFGLSKANVGVTPDAPSNDQQTMSIKSDDGNTDKTDTLDDMDALDDGFLVSHNTFYHYYKEDNEIDAERNSPFPPIHTVTDRNECYRIAEIYYHGSGVEQNFDEAAKWYEKAAKMGHVDAQCDLGNCYYYGEGLPENYERSVYWYEKAAEQGNVRALYNLGNSYYYGEGASQNRTLAIAYYERAAALGNPQAKVRLNELGIDY